MTEERIPPKVNMTQIVQQAGSTEIRLNDGKRYRLRWTFNDIANIELVTKKFPEQLDPRSFNDVRAAVWAGMGDRYESLTIAEVGDLLTGLNFRALARDVLGGVLKSCEGPEPDSAQSGNE